MALPEFPAELRGTGRTTRQMKEAPNNAVFVWCNSQLGYPKDLQRHIVRDDLRIWSPHELNRASVAGKGFTGIVVDHACELTGEQAHALNLIRERIKQTVVKPTPIIKAVPPTPDLSNPITASW